VGDGAGDEAAQVMEMKDIGVERDGDADVLLMSRAPIP
jgi:hypothetical protein